jgi:hypothetical protein
MAITKQPKRKPNASAAKHEERAVEAFISGAEPQPNFDTATGKKIPFMVRFDADVLNRVDEAAKRRGISRSAWIQFVASRALDQGEG